MMMTPRYASPEQLRQLRMQPVTTQSDTYSLGVTLYELLSGTGPFGPAGSPLEELFRLAENRAPNPLGIKLGDGAGERRGVTDQALAKLLSGDLRVIVAKCLEFSPDSRYSSVDALAEDLNAWLEHRPVLARSRTLRYQLGMFVGRNRATVGVAVAAGLAVMAGIAGTIWQGRLASQRFEDVRQLARYQVFDLFDELAKLDGTTALRGRLVERSMVYLDALRGQSGTNPRLGAEIAESYLRLGNLLGNPLSSNLGRPAEARKAFAKAREIAKESNDPEARRVLAMLEFHEATLPGYAGPPAAIQRAADRATEILRGAIRQRPDDAMNHFYLGEILESRGFAAQQGGGQFLDTDVSTEWYRPALDSYREAARLGADPALVEFRSLRIAYRTSMLKGTVDPAQAVREHEQLLASIRALTPTVRRQSHVRSLEAKILGDIGWSLGQAGKYAEAQGRLDDCVAILRPMSEAEPDDRHGHYDLSDPYRTKGIIHGYAGQWRMAIDNYQLAVAEHERILAAGPDAQSAFMRAELIRRQSEAWSKLGDAGRARELAEQSLRLVRDLADKPEPATPHLMEAARQLLTNPVVELRNYPAALDYSRKLLERSPRHLAGRQLLAWALVRIGEVEDADKVVRALAADYRFDPTTKGGTQLDESIRELAAAVADLKATKTGARQ